MIFDISTFYRIVVVKMLHRKKEVKREGNNRRNADTRMNLEITRYIFACTEHRAIVSSLNAQASTCCPGLTNAGRRKPDGCGTAAVAMATPTRSRRVFPPKLSHVLSNRSTAPSCKNSEVDCFPPKLSFVEHGPLHRGMKTTTLAIRE